jgi:hypothetical protein
VDSTVQAGDLVATSGDNGASRRPTSRRHRHECEAQFRFRLARGQVKPSADVSKLNYVKVLLYCVDCGRLSGARTTAIRWVRVPLVILVGLAVQTTFFADMQPFDALADIMVLLAITAGAVAGPAMGPCTASSPGWPTTSCSARPVRAVGAHVRPRRLRRRVPAGVDLGGPLVAGSLVVGAASAVAIAGYAVIGTVFGLKMRSIPTSSP